MAESLPGTRIDFDHWSALASSDPEGFETQRAELLERVIARAPAHRQRRLRGLQWKLDQVRCTAKTPMAACVRMNEMMWESVLGAGGLRDRLGLVLHGPGDVPEPNSAAVLPFRAPARNQGTTGLS